MAASLHVVLEWSSITFIQAPSTKFSPKTLKEREFFFFFFKKMGIVGEAHNVNVVGSGEKVVVLAHGFGTDQSVWKYLVPHLVEEYRVVLFDNMGAGTTNPDYYDFERYSTIEGFVYDLLAILEELEIQSCIFVGHSFSSMVGAIASVSRPDLFLKIIMLSATPRYNTNLCYSFFL